MSDESYRPPDEPWTAASWLELLIVVLLATWALLFISGYKLWWLLGALIVVIVIRILFVE